MVDHPRIGEAGERAADLLRQVRMQRRHSLDMRLVDYGLGPVAPGPDILAPCESRIDHHTFRHHEGAVAAVDGQILAPRSDAIAETGIVPANIADERLGVGVDQQLVRIEAMAARRVIGTVHAVAVKLTGPDIRQVAVPDLMGLFRQIDTLGFAPALRVEQAELDAGRVGGKQRKVDAFSVPCRPQRIGQAGENAHAHRCAPVIRMKVRARASPTAAG